jgi:ribonuclease Z
MIESSNSFVQAKLVNGVSGDPALFCFFPLSGKALLLDAGNIEALSNKDILRVKYVCISHTHIDHFIGFDRLLRVHIPHQRPIHLYGPEGLAANVMGKLNGYSWNLLVDNQITFHVTECRPDGSLREVVITNEPRFVEKLVYDWKPAQLLTLEPGLQLSILPLEHGSIMSCTFSFAVARKNSIKMDVLAELGLKPGPWIAKLQDYLKSGEENRNLDIEGKTYHVGTLGRKVCQIQPPYRFMYITDVSYSAENIVKLRARQEALDLLIIESCFREVDYPRAFSKKHLTTKQAALYATLLRAAVLETFHYSQIYGGQTEAEQGAEAQEHFARFRELPTAELNREMDQELARGQTP